MTTSTVISLPRPTRILRLLAISLLIPGMSACSLGPLGAANPSDQVLAIASIVPTSGVDGPLGWAMRRGVDLAVRQHVRLAAGYRLTFVHLDEASQPLGRRIARLATKRHVMGVVGPLDSGRALSMLPALQRWHMAAISPGATLPGLTEAAQARAEGLTGAELHPGGTSIFFRLPESDTTAGKIAADLAVTPAGASGLAAHSVFIVDDGSLSGKTQATAFGAELSVKGGAMAGRRSIAPGDPISPQSVVTAIIEANPDLVFFTGGTAAGALLRRTLSLTGAPKLGILTAGPIANHPGWSRAVGVPAASAYTTGLLPAPALSAIPGAKRFVAAYHRAFPGKALLAQSALAYDAAMDEISAMKALITIGQKVTRSSVRARVSSTSYRGVTGPIAFDRNGDDVASIGFSLYTCDLKGVWHYRRAVGKS